MKKPPRVRLIYLDPRFDGAKVGLDDFFAAGGVLGTLIAKAATTLRPLPQEESETDPLCPYEVSRQGISMRKAVGDKLISIPLTNFIARITGDTEKDDGVETQRFFELGAQLGNRFVRKSIAADRFANMSWVTDLLGAQAIIYPGQATKDHVRVAIQKLSQEIVERRIYAHLGWRKIDGQWGYLHAGGAIDQGGSMPGIEVSVPDKVDLYVLPNPPQGPERITTIRASLRLLDVMPRRLTIPCYAAVWRAPLGEVDCSLFLYGKSGKGKSELAALMQQHYGAGMDRLHLPANFSSTGNSLEGIAFAAKDALLVIDDFCPTGSTADIQRYHREADRIFRAQGNHSARQRMRADGTLRPAKPPRGLILATGEDLPRGQSLGARLCALEASEGDMNWQLLTECQKDAAAGHYAATMAAYLQWLAPRYEAVKNQLKEEIYRLRAQALQRAHKRTPEIIANLALGVL